MWLCTMLWKTLHYTNWYLKSIFFVGPTLVKCSNRLLNNKNSNNIKMYKKRTIEEMQQRVPFLYTHTSWQSTWQKNICILKSGFALCERFQAAMTPWGQMWLETNINAQGRIYRPHFANDKMLAHTVCNIIISSPWVCEIP